jgi:hypothetical protein
VPVGILAAAGGCVALLVIGLIVLSNLNDRPSGTGNRSARSGRPAVATGQLPRSSFPLDDDDLRGGAGSSTSTAKDIAAEEIKKAAVIHGSWSEGKLGRLEAQEQLERLLEGSTDPDARSSIEKSLAAIRNAGRREAQDAVAKIGAQVEEHLGARQFKEARALLESFDRDFPEETNLADPVRQKCDESLSEFLGQVGEEVGALVEKADFAAARARVKDLSARVVPSDSAGVSRLGEQIAEAERLFEEAAAGLQAAARSVRLAISDLDFERADQLLDDVVGDRQALLERAAPLRREVEVTRQVWQQLEKSLEAAIGARRTLALKSAPSPVAAALGVSHEDRAAARSRFRPLSLAGSVLRMQPPGGRLPPESCSVLAVETESLLSLLKPDGAAGEDDLREGLGLLLLLRRGPERAGSLLLAAGLDEARRRLNEARIGEAGTIWLRTRYDEACRRADEYAESSPPAPGDAWDFLAQDVAELILFLKGRSGGDEERARLAELYLKAREQALRLLPPEDLFHAKTIEQHKEGLIRLTYDFSTAEQLEDFVSSKGAGASVGWVESRKLLQLRGEARFLAGNPFTGWLGVAATVAGCEADAPNINVAFWTHDGEGVTLRPEQLDLRNWREGGQSTPEDYLVFGMGYLLEIDLEKVLGPWERFARGVKGLIPVYMKEPSYVILAGSRGKTLHQRRSERLWDAALGKKLKGAARFEIELKEGNLKWIFNRSKVPYLASTDLKRLLEVPRRGSVNFFTNGHDVYYAALEIWGRLDSGWVEERARARAREELERLQGEE